jgi:FMN phosphatase YigB (HAD superfamily)
MAPSLQPFDAILFDLGGVLIELAGVEQMLEWSPGIDTIDELWRRWLRSPAVRCYETGAATGEEFAADNRINVEAAASLGLTARHVRNFAALAPAFAELDVTD